MHWVSIYRDSAASQRITTQVIKGTADDALKYARRELEKALKQGVDLYVIVQTLTQKSAVFDLTTVRSRIHLPLGIN